MDLSLNRLGDAEASAIAEALKLNKTLTRLEADMTYIGAGGAIEIAEALKVKTLTRLDVDRNNIGSAGARALRSIARSGCKVEGLPGGGCCVVS